MTNAGEDAKGRVKEAAGALTGDEGMRREGKVDQASASVKDGVEKAGQKAQEGVDAVKDKLTDS